jgi:hypothetical protein
LNHRRYAEFSLTGAKSTPSSLVTGLASIMHSTNKYMKTATKLLLVSITLILGSSSPQTFGAVGVSASVQINAVADFHAPLASHGSWVEVRSYGRCWRPASVAVEWRPYAYGSWVWTDYGWYWESDEPWSWACYHYGNWIYESDFGWIWVPGIEWSPAWVSWRTGGGYWGWAPLPPRGVVIAPRAFVFVETRRFHEPIRPTTVIVNNTTIINNTTEIRNTRREIRDAQDAPAARVVVNEGPKREEVEQATGGKVRSMAARDISRRARDDANQNLRGKKDQPAANQPVAPTPEQNKVAPNPVTPAKPEKDKDTVVRPSKPTAPERPTSPDKPTKPEKPGLPEKPVVPPQPAQPEKPSQIEPKPEKPAAPRQPSEERNQKSRDKYQNERKSKEGRPR